MAARPPTRARLFLEKTLSALQAGQAVPARPAELFPVRMGKKGWLKPQLSAKAVARLRKQAIISGADWPWDTPKKPIKVHDVDRKKRADTIARVTKIEAGIVTAKERLADYFKARAATYKYGSTMAKFFQQVDKPKAVLPGGSQRGKK